MKQSKNTFIIALLLLAIIVFAQTAKSQCPPICKNAPAKKTKIQVQSAMSTVAPTATIANTYPTLLTNNTDVYFAFEHPTAKWIIIAGHDKTNFTNVVKRIDASGIISTFTLPKCRSMFNSNPQLFVSSVTFNGDLIVTGQFDRCELFVGDPYPLGVPGIVKVKANGQIDQNFNPDFYAAGSPMCQTVPLPGGMGTRKYCQPINFQAVHAFNPLNFVYVHGNFSSINGNSLPTANQNNLIKLNVTNGQNDLTFTAPNITGTVKGIDGGYWGTNGNSINVWGDFTVSSPPRKNLMVLNSDGSVNAQFDPTQNIDGSINSIGSGPYPGYPQYAAGAFSKYKNINNYSQTPFNTPIKNLVKVDNLNGGLNFSPGSGYFISWESVSPFEIVSMDISLANGAFCAGGSNNSLVCFGQGFVNSINPNQYIAPTATPIAVNGNVKVVFNIFNTNEFLIGGDFTQISGQTVKGFARITFTK